MPSFNFNKFIRYGKKNSFNKLQEEYNLVTESLKKPISPRTKRRLTAKEHELAEKLNKKFESMLLKLDIMSRFPSPKTQKRIISDYQHKKRKEEILSKFPSSETQKKIIQKYYQQKLNEEILSRFPSPETQKQKIDIFLKEQEAKQRKALEALRNANSLTAKSLAEFGKVLAPSSVRKTLKKKKSSKGGALRKKSRKVRKSRKN